MELKAACILCGCEQFEMEGQMARCSKCKTVAGDKASIQKKLNAAAEKEVKKIEAYLKKSLSKLGFK
jgi:hypothetical protein